MNKLSSLPHEQEEEAITAPTKPCPFCAESIKAAALICPYCGRDVRATGPDLLRWLAVLGGLAILWFIAELIEAGILNP